MRDRVAPWLPALVTAVAAVVLRLPYPGGSPGMETQQAAPVLPAGRPAAETCSGLTGSSAALMASLSEQAAALTGSLALVKREDRPGAAAEAAWRIRSLAVRAAEAGGDALSETLVDLVEALEGYATGDPAALAGVQAASAHNAQLRESYLTCGGER